MRIRAYFKDIAFKALALTIVYATLYPFVFLWHCVFPFFIDAYCITMEEESK